MTTDDPYFSFGITKEAERAILDAAGHGPVQTATISLVVGNTQQQVGVVLRRNGWTRHTHKDKKWYYPPAPPRTKSGDPPPAHAPPHAADPPRAASAPPPSPQVPVQTTPLELPVPSNLPPPQPRRFGSLPASFVRVAVPDSHGAHIDLAARDAFLGDLQRLDPAEVVMLGDHLDCGGTFSAHQRTYTNEMTESYEDDVVACNEFLDAIQRAAPRATIHYIEGNHEQHVERWAARNFFNKKDAEMMLEKFGPEAVLHLKARGIPYYRRSEHYMGVSIPGTIRLGKVFFTHGIAHNKAAADTHVARFGANVVFGHVHRDVALRERSVTSDARGAWCPGTLAKLQPLYKHTAPSNWTHGYHVQFVNPSGNFFPANVPIFGGTSMLMELVGAVHRLAKEGP